MQFIEKFNADKLNHIITNEEKYHGLIIDENAEDSNYNPFTTLKRYLRQSKDGVANVEYEQKNKSGRWFAKGGLSLQSFPKVVRHTIASEFYTDIDMRNAHPVILSHICKAREIPTIWLDQYINNRDEKLASIPADADTAKTIVLALVNGGNSAYESLTSKPDWLVAFAQEMKIIHHTFSKDKDFKKFKTRKEKEGKTYNIEASYMNSLICNLENEILMTIHSRLGKPNYCVLCFDGLMIQNDLAYEIADLEHAVKTALHIDIQLVVKPMSKVLEMDSVISYTRDVLINTFSRTENPYTYHTFYNEFASRVFDSFEELDEVIGSKYQDVVAKILKGKCSFVKRLDIGVDIVDKLSGSDLIMHYKDDKDKIKTMTISQYISKKQCFSDYVCRMDDCDPKYFNIWSGFQAKHTTRTEPSKGLTALLSFIREIWASNNEEYFNYIISWFAHLFTNTAYSPVNPPINKIALVLISKQGTGKGFLVTFMNYLLGSENTVEALGIGPITQKHNTLIQNKRLIVINEMASTKDEFRSNFDRIKGMITDPRISIEPKGVSPYMIDNIGNYILVSNHENSVVIEQSDRRYAVFEISTARIQDIEYFIELDRLCCNQDVADEFYTFLMNFEQVPLSKIPNTEIKQSMVDLSKPSSQKFIEDADYLRTRNAGEISENVLKITPGNLYAQYKDWCNANGERSVSNKVFGMYIKNIPFIDFKHTMKGNIYVITLPAMFEDEE